MTVTRKSPSAALLAACLLAGCGSAPPVARDVAAGRVAAVILSPALTAASPGSGILIVHREDTPLGSGCGSRILVDGKPVAELDRNEHVTLYLAPGEHVLGARTAGNICPMRIVEATVPVVALERRAFQLRVRFGVESTLELVPVL